MNRRRNAWTLTISKDLLQSEFVRFFNVDAKVVLDRQQPLLQPSAAVARLASQPCTWPVDGGAGYLSR